MQSAVRTGADKRSTKGTVRGWAPMEQSGPLTSPQGSKHRKSRNLEWEGDFKSNLSSPATQRSILLWERALCLPSSQCGVLIAAARSQLSPKPKAARRQEVNEASSSTPLIDCKTLLSTIHLTLIINWGVLPALGDDLMPPEVRVFPARMLQLGPSLHTSLPTGTERGQKAGSSSSFLSVSPWAGQFSAPGRELTWGTGSVSGTRAGVTISLDP